VPYESVVLNDQIIYLKDQDYLNREDVLLRRLVVCPSE
jgi:hypothetical protein